MMKLELADDAAAAPLSDIFVACLVGVFDTATRGEMADFDDIDFEAGGASFFLPSTASLGPV